MPDAYGLFGFPVHHSWSPFIHGLFARQTGQEMTYRLFETPPERFRHDVLEFFTGGQGCNVTLPHKRAAAELVNDLTPRAQLADAVNTIVRDERHADRRQHRWRGPAARPRAQPETDAGGTPDPAARRGWCRAGVIGPLLAASPPRS